MSVVVGQLLFFIGLLFNSSTVKKFINRVKLNHVINHCDEYEWQPYDFGSSWKELGYSKKDAFMIRDVLKIAGFTMKSYKKFYMISGPEQHLHPHDEVHYVGSSAMTKGWGALQQSTCVNTKGSQQKLTYTTLNHVKEEIINKSARFYEQSHKDYPYEGASFTDDTIDISGVMSRDAFLRRVRATPGVGSRLMLERIRESGVLDYKMLHDYLYHKKVFLENHPEMENVPEEWIVAAYL